MTAVEVGVVNASEVVSGGLPVAAWRQRGTWIDEHWGLHDVELVDARRESITVSS